MSISGRFFNAVHNFFRAKQSHSAYPLHDVPQSFVELDVEFSEEVIVEHKEQHQRSDRRSGGKLVVLDRRCLSLINITQTNATNKINKLESANPTNSTHSVYQNPVI